MNAAARLVHQGVISRHLVLTHLLSRRQFVALILTLGILISALGIVYATYGTRVLYANYQRNLIDQTHLRVEQGQLLLERGAWMVPARIEQIAGNKLNMLYPRQKEIIMIK